MSSWRCRWLLCVTAVIVLLGADRCPAAPDTNTTALELELRFAAAEIVEFVQAHGNGTIAVDRISAPPDTDTNAGTGVRLELIHALQQVGAQLQRESAQFVVSGRYFAYDDTSTNRASTDGNPLEATNLLGVQLSLQLSDAATGEVVLSISRVVFGTETVPQMLGMNLSGPPALDPVTISENWQSARKTPQLAQEVPLVRGLTDRYELRVSVAGVSQTATPSPLPTVRVPRSLPLTIRLINDSADEAAVSLRIAGADSLWFDPSGVRYWIVPAHSHLDIAGWRLPAGQSHPFALDNLFPQEELLATGGDPAAAVQVSAAFSACWKEEAARPADEPPFHVRCTTPGELDADIPGLGRRTIGQVRDVLTLRLLPDDRQSAR
jgi:hypothetical protein